MRKVFRRHEVRNAYGQSTEEASARPFRRIVRILCLVVVAFVALGCALVQWRYSHTLDARLSRMERDISRAIADALDRNQNQLEALRRGQRTTTAWRESLKTSFSQTQRRRSRPRSMNELPQRQQDRIQAMYALEERGFRRWQALLSPREWADDGLSPEERRQLVRKELLQEQEKWGPPPPPAVVFVLATGTRRFLDGAVGGIVWPYGVAVRGWQSFSAGDALSFGAKMRRTFFPWGLAAFTGTWLLGFGIMAAAIGYFLCWLGVKSGSDVLSYAGLLYFLYVVVFVACIFLLIAGILV